MVNYLQISDNFAKFVAWIGGSCKPSEKGKLTAFPRFIYCQRNVNKNVSNMLRFEELPEVNSERWLSLEDLPGEIWKYIPKFPLYKLSNYSRIKSFARKDRKKPIIIKESLSVKGYYFVELKHESKYTGVKRASMNGCCIGNHSHAGGFFWKYVPMQYIIENLVFDINGRCIDKQKFKDDN